MDPFHNVTPLRRVDGGKPAREPFFNIPPVTQALIWILVCVHLAVVFGGPGSALRRQRDGLCHHGHRAADAIGVRA